MKPGDTIENAIWLDGTEKEWQRKAYEKEVARCITETCANEGFMHGEVIFHVKHPNDARVPPVPEHIKTLCPRLLVAETDIVGMAIEEVSSSFIADIEPRDLLRLRQITRNSMAKLGEYINDAEADAIIEAIGPVAAEDTLRRAVLN